MIGFHLARQRGGAWRYYRVDIAYNLFGEYSVQRKWGLRGRHGALGGSHRTAWFSNLRDACLAAERWQKRAMRRGYARLAREPGHNELTVI